MVRYFANFSIFIFASYCFAQINVEVHKPQTATQAQLKGAVHTLQIRTQYMKIIEGKATTDALTLEMETVYDERGQMTEAKFYNANGLLRRSNSYSYQGDSLIKTQSDLYNSESKLYRKTEYQYDKAGEITKQTNYDFDEKGQLFRQTVLSRDSAGKLSATDYKSNGTLFKRYLFSSPQSGRSVKKEASTPEKKNIELKRRLIYDEIDAQGNWTKMTIFGGVDIINDQKVETREITYRTITYF